MNNPQLQDAQKRAQDMLNRLGIDAAAAITVLVAALASGLLAGIVDGVLAMPHFSVSGKGDFDGNWLFAGAFVAVLNGAVYAYLKEKEDLAGAVMAAVAGVTTFLLWWIVTKIIGDQDVSRLVQVNPADAFNFLEVLIDGALMGLIGFGWLALLRRLPDVGGMLLKR